MLVPERRKIFETLTLEDNLRLAMARSAELTRDELERLFEMFPMLSERRQQIAGYLSGGERQMLAISQALFCEAEADAGG